MTDDEVKARALLDEYYAFPEILRLKAQVHFLQERIRKISKLGKARVDAWIELPKSTTDLMQSINQLTELSSAINVVDHIKFMKEEFA